tara:strand:+ start:133 stop:384 length:252 start_codon:yes stop_codon:yes gene_type:complete
MKQKNLPNDINIKSLSELKDMANNIVEKLEKVQNLEDSVEEYQKLVKLNNIIEKKFQKTSKDLSIEKNLKIRKILKKNAKKIK